MFFVFVCKILFFNFLIGHKHFQWSNYIFLNANYMYAYWIDIIFLCKRVLQSWIWNVIAVMKTFIFVCSLKIYIRCSAIDFATDKRNTNVLKSLYITGIELWYFFLFYGAFIRCVLYCLGLWKSVFWIFT